MARLPVHGILLVDKPVGLSSQAAVSRAKRALAAAKAGHTGTLDPLASGLLPLCFGEATKFASDLLDAQKRYQAEVCLGRTTTTGDAEGEVLESRPVRVDEGRIDEVLNRFRGEIEQVPPMYSALKRAGKPLYEYARQGIILERAARRVSIHALTRVTFANDLLAIDVTCSKGTYIRTLAEDIGEALGCGAHLKFLRRLEVGALTLADAIALGDLEALPPASRHERLLPVDRLVQALDVIHLDPPDALRFCHGQRLAVEPRVADERVRVYRSEEVGSTFLGVGRAGPDGVLIPVRLLTTGLDFATTASHD